MLYKPLPRNLEAALRDATHAKVEVRVSAVRDLVPHAEDDRGRVLGALEKALGDSNGLVRAAAAEGLGEIEAKEALPALLVAVEDQHAIVRQNAILALGQIGDVRAQKRLERALTDERPDVRFQAVMAYPRVATSREDAMKALVVASEDEDPSVAQIAFRMAEELSEDADGLVDEEMLSRAIASLSHDSEKVRAVAAVLVASAGRADGDAILIDAARGKLRDAEPEDVAAAIELTGARGLQEARPALERRAFGGLLGSRDPFQWQARVALARLGDARAKKQILGELESSSFDRCALAVSAAGRARLTEAKPILESLKTRPERAERSAVETALRQIAKEEGT